MNVNSYIREEVRRQLGLPDKPALHGTDSEFIEACMDMARAWGWWSERQKVFGLGRDTFLPHDVEDIARRVHPWANRGGFRRVRIFIAGKPEVKFAEPEDIPRLMEQWCFAVREETLTPNEAYVEFEKIHPFMDGNGRTGKVIYCWLKECLDDPVWPDAPKEWRVP